MAPSRAALRKHLPFFILLPPLIIVMTFPALAQAFDTTTFSAPTRNTDLWQKLWDVWHWERFLAGETSFYHTQAMFHPLGASLAFENFSLPQMAAVSALGRFLPADDAFSMTYLLIVFAVAGSAYVYLHYLFRDSWLAAFGAVVFSLCQHILAHAAHPDVNFIVPLPLALYFFQRGILEGRFRLLLLCGIVAGFAAFMSLYIFVCVLLSLALTIAGFAVSRWREPRFWRWTLALALVIALGSAPRLLPMLADADELDSALEKSASKETGTDLLSYFVNYRHPLTTPALKSMFGAESPFYEPHTSYLGYLPLALVVFGFFQRSVRRKTLPWLGLALPFLLLRLGSVLRVDGVDYAQIVLPKSLLDDLLPAVFSPFHAPDHFQMGVLLPLAVMACYGLKALLVSRPGRQRRLATLALITLVAFEYYETPAARVLPAEQTAFVAWLRQEEAEREPRLINLPLGRQPSKLYGFYQTLAGYPQVEGLTGRTPDAAYAFIESNALLAAWREGKSALCFPWARADYSAALDQLEDAGFSHVLWHRWLEGAGPIAGSFADAPPAYRDDYLSIYRVGELRQSCRLAKAVAPSVLPHLQRLEASPVIVPRQGAAILSILADHETDSSQSAPAAARLFGAHRDHALRLNGGVVSAAAGAEVPVADDLLADLAIVLLAYDRRDLRTHQIDPYRLWLASQFNSCRRFSEPDALIEVFLRADFPCELALAEQPFAVRYDRGVELGNLLVDAERDSLDISLLWTRLPAEAHSVSIQFFAADGARVAGEDFVISQSPLARHHIDTSSLPAGDYRLMMIVYNYETGASLGGFVAADQTRFERELLIGRVSA